MGKVLDTSHFYASHPPIIQPYIWSFCSVFANPVAGVGAAPVKIQRLPSITEDDLSVSFPEVLVDEPNLTYSSKPNVEVVEPSMYL
jgi:hypothetical protein